MTRDDRKEHETPEDREALDVLRSELEASAPPPTPADRAALLAACEPALVENARNAAAARAGRTARILAWIGAHPAPAAAFAAVAVVLVVLLLAPPFPTRATRSAPLRTWAEHVSASTTAPGRPLPVAVATFGRPY